MVALDDDYFRALELPRMAALSPDLIAAAFPLMKLMPARYILDRAVADGALEAGKRIVETTSGTFGMALALLAAARGYRLTLVSASSLVDTKYKARLDGLGAQMIITEDLAGNGDQLTRLKRLEHIRREEPDCFWPRQYDNLGNSLAYARLAELLVRTVGQIDCLVGCVGSGGSFAGRQRFCARSFRISLSSRSTLTEAFSLDNLPASGCCAVWATASCRAMSGMTSSMRSTGLGRIRRSARLAACCVNMASSRGRPAEPRPSLADGLRALSPEPGSRSSWRTTVTDTRTRSSMTRGSARYRAGLARRLPSPASSL